MSDLVLFRINNWKKHQHYPGESRNQIWIKLYKDILRSDAWVSMTDAEKGQLIGLMLIVNSSGEYRVNAANMLRTYGEHTANIRQTACLRRAPDLRRFENLGLITIEIDLNESSASNLLAIEEKRREEKKENTKLDSITSRKLENFGSKIKPGNEQIQEAINKGILKRATPPLALSGQGVAGEV
jgi:hypothetical protein